MMKATIIQSHGNLVQVETAIGTFWGVWCDSKPVKLKNYVLELDCDTVITPKDVQVSTFQKPFIFPENGIVRLNGYVEEVEDGVLFLRLDTAIMMLEVSSDVEFSTFVGKYLCVVLDHVDVYDTGVY